MPKNVWEVLWYMSSLLVHASDLWPRLLGVRNVISYMADADDLSGLMITTFHFYSMCTFMAIILVAYSGVQVRYLGQVDICFARLEGKGLSAVLRDCRVCIRHIIIMSGG